MTREQGIVVICLLVCLLVVACVQTTLQFAAQILPLVVANEQLTLDANVDVPETVTMGEEFDILLETKNLHDKPIKLHSIDIETSFLAGFDVLSVTPVGFQTGEIDGYRTWRFAQSVAPGASRRVTFRLKALREGQFAGDIDVCNPNLDYTSVYPIVKVVKNDQPAK